MIEVYCTIHDVAAAIADITKQFNHRYASCTDVICCCCAVAFSQNRLLIDYEHVLLTQAHKNTWKMASASEFISFNKMSELLIADIAMLIPSSSNTSFDCEVIGLMGAGQKSLLQQTVYSIVRRGANIHMGLHERVRVFSLENVLIPT